jgi:hypothetical protein
MLNNLKNTNMKKFYFLFIILISTASFGQNMVITGAFDGPLPQGTPKVIELYVIADIPDLSVYGIGSANNGGGTDDEELTFDAVNASAGDFIYITTTLAEFSTYFGFAADYENSMAGINGDDALELFFNGGVIDTFGDINTDGTGEAWDHVDGWAYRKNNTGPDDTTFNLSSWTFSGINATDGCTTNTTCSSVYPYGTFTYGGTPCGVSLGTATYSCASNTIGDNNDGVTVLIPYTGSDTSGGTLSTTSGGTVVGDISVADDTISITGLTEGDAWDLTITGGDCDATTISGTIPAAECDPTPNTCYDLSTGTDFFELVSVTPNSGFANDGMWENTTGTYTANAYCGSGCNEPVEGWLILGPLDMTGVTDLELIFDATKSFTDTDLIIAYTDTYIGCPTSSTWTTAQTLTASGSYSVDLSGATGTGAFIGIQYADDGGYSGWSLSNVELASFNSCPVLGTPPVSNCAVCDLTLQTETYACQSNTAGDNNDGVTVEIPYTGSETSGGTLSTTSGGTVAGDISVADGTISITGLTEGDAWDLIITGGDCDGTVSGTIPASVCDPVTMDLVINELLADPHATTGDANGDGTINTSDDEFIEFYNVGAGALDISGYTVEDASSVRHTFPASTIIPAGEFLTLFGNGTPTGISGISQVASSGTVGLNNGGDTVTVRNVGGAIVVTETYTGVTDQSVCREPDFTGAFVGHLSHTTNPVQFTPGVSNDTVLSLTKDSIEGFAIYPNPVSNGEFSIRTNGGVSKSVQIFDMLGKQVYSKQVQANENVRISNLNSGIYILKVQEEGRLATRKLVVQ